jgi:hypothetical protein
MIDQPKYAFIILTHSNPSQLRRQVGLLMHERVKLLVHVDASVDQGVFEEAVAEYPVTFCASRYRSHWGSFEIVRATLACISEILNDASIQRVSLISGSCLPLLSIDNLIQHYDERGDSAFIEIKPLQELEGSHWMKRVKYTWIRWGDGKYQINPLPRYNSRELLKKTGLILTFLFRSLWNGKVISPGHVASRMRIQYRDYPFMIGSQWWSLPRFVLDKIDSICQEDKSIVEFFSTTLIPDELFFQTLVGHFIDCNELVVSAKHTYARWPSRNSPSPDFLNNEGVEFFLKLRSEGYLFCRKFDDLPANFLIALNNGQAEGASLPDQ